MNSVSARAGAMVLGLLGTGCSIEPPPMPDEWKEATFSLDTSINRAIEVSRQPGTIDSDKLRTKLDDAAVLLNGFLPELETHFYPDGKLPEDIRVERERLATMTVNPEVGLGLLTDLRDPAEDHGLEFGLKSFKLNLEYPSDHALVVGYNFSKMLEVARDAVSSDVNK